MNAGRDKTRLSYAEFAERTRGEETMIAEKVDLYEYFKIPRKGDKCGFLTVYRHAEMPEMGIDISLVTTSNALYIE